MEKIQFPFEAARDILLGPSPHAEPALVDPAPAFVRTFILRERQAAEPFAHTLSDYPSFVCSPSDYGISNIFEERDGFFVGWLGLTSRPTHIVVPRAEAVIYDLDIGQCRRAWDSCWRPPKESLGPGRIGVVSMRETPGIGDKILTDKGFLANFEALDVQLKDDLSALANDVKVVKHGTKTQAWQIDAISGATITSRAVGKGVNEAAQLLLPRLVPKLNQLEKP